MNRRVSTLMALDIAPGADYTWEYTYRYLHDPLGAHV